MFMTSSSVPVQTTLGKVIMHPAEAHMLFLSLQETEGISYEAINL